MKKNAEPTFFDLVKISYQNSTKLGFIKAGIRYLKATIKGA